MANMTEIQVAQKERLYDLLYLEKKNAGYVVKGLSSQIRKAKAGMSKEDVAYVEQLIAEEDDL